MFELCFKCLCLSVPETNNTQNFSVWKQERNTNEEVKRLLSTSSPILANTVHPLTVHVCTKLCRRHISWGMCDENFNV